MNISLEALSLIVRALRRSSISRMSQEAAPLIAQAVASLQRVAGPSVPYTASDVRLVLADISVARACLTELFNIVHLTIEEQALVLSANAILAIAEAQYTNAKR